MKKAITFSFVLLIIGIVSPIFAQKDNTKKREWLKSETVLTYHLINVNKEYDFIVSNLLLDKNISFSWKMTDPVNYSGTMEISNDALDTATTIINYFQNNTSKKLLDRTTIWLSRKIYKTIKSQTPISITIDGIRQTLKFLRNEKYTFKLDENEHQEDVLLAETESGNRFWILDNPKYPLIVKMEISFSIELKSVQTKK